ncbi:MAG: MBOAT family protein [Pseudomonadota bacterium]
MLFQSQEFVLVFLPVVLAGYWIVAGSASARQWLLIVASLTFYGWWDIRFLPLLIAHAVLTWLLAKLYCRLRRPAIIILAIALNLTSLATFKYADFLLRTLEDITRLDLPRNDILLPIGISFFTFQLVSYLVDVRRGTAPEYPFRTFFLFATFFPQLIAGPIVRHNEIIDQFARDPRRDGMHFRLAAGSLLFTLGFAKKVFLADRLAPTVDALFLRAQTEALGFADAWSATLGFSFQLFLDFSAYSEMAIGLGLLFGFVLPENFNRPYLATSLRDFWRRWHITLSRFLRDYLYIPIGGSRHGMAVYVFATLVTMGLCGLWHGAGWTFVAWGLMHGVGLILCHAWQKSGMVLPPVLGWAATMLFVAFGWILFRSPDFTTAWSMMQAALGTTGTMGDVHAASLLMLAAAVAVIVPSAHRIMDKTLVPSRLVAGASALILTIAVLEVGNAPPAAFIYFQF